MARVIYNRCVQTKKPKLWKVSSKKFLDDIKKNKNIEPSIYKVKLPASIQKS